MRKKRLEEKEGEESPPKFIPRSVPEQDRPATNNGRWQKWHGRGVVHTDDGAQLEEVLWRHKRRQHGSWRVLNQRGVKWYILRSYEAL
jgi:hypothetical protein